MDTSEFEGSIDDIIMSIKNSEIEYCDCTQFKNCFEQYNDSNNDSDDDN